MIHEPTTLETKAFSNAKVYAALQQRLPDAGGTLVGALAAGIGALSRVLLPRKSADANAVREARHTFSCWTPTRSAAASGGCR
jgi:hypothetical protein